MCGINGFNFVNKSLLKKMNDSLAHRGPNSEGTLIKEGLSLGHRRLSILDISSKGHQPMEYRRDGKKVWITFNGEIFNYLEIKETLIKKGYTFNSNTDTEVILASYLEWGEECVNRFNGMWAFCIYDLEDNCLFLSRDRLGKKPLYYFFNGQRFIFSSEIKSILHHKIHLKINQKAIDLYLSMGFIPSPYSIYEEIFKLEPGHNIIFNLPDKTISIKKYYEYPAYRPRFNKKFLMEEGRRILGDAIRIRMISDVPLGAFLSGGMDSSAIVAGLINEVNKHNAITFSIKMKSSRDYEYVKIFQEHFRLKNYCNDFKESEFLELSKKIFYFFDEPFSDYSMFPSFYLSKFAAKKITVALSGDGGDEIFGGYNHYKSVAKIALLKRIPKPVRKLLIKLIPEARSTFLFLEGLRISLKKSEEIFSDSWEGVYKPKIYQNLSRKKMAEMLKLAKGDLVEAAILYDRYFKTLGDNFLCKTDRASMANSLEVRSPFLDYRFIEYSSQIPSRWKANIFSTKILMKNLLKGTIPDEIIRRKKEGFNSSELQRWIASFNSQSVVQELFEMGVISPEWHNFLINLDFKKEIHLKYLARSVLLLMWFKYWSDKIKNEKKH